MTIQKLLRSLTLRQTEQLALYFNKDLMQYFKLRDLLLIPIEANEIGLYNEHTFNHHMVVYTRLDRK